MRIQADRGAEARRSAIVKLLLEHRLEANDEMHSYLTGLFKQPLKKSLDGYSITI